MSHQQDFARDVAAVVHTVLTDDWFFSYSDELITEAVARMPKDKISIPNAIGHAIISAEPFTEYLGRPGLLSLARTVWSDIAQAVAPLAADYGMFLMRQLELKPLLRRKQKTPAKVLPATAEQRQALEEYVADFLRRQTLKSRNFPPNVVDLVQLRAQRASQ